MADLEKVIKGLESCSPDYPRLIKCVGCPYEQNCRHGGRNESLLMDALTLLKEQEAVEPVLEQDSMVCGVCGHEVIWQKMIGDGLWADEQLDYCPHCGRAVKWFRCPLEYGGQYADQPTLREAT